MHGRPDLNRSLLRAFLALPFWPVEKVELFGEEHHCGELGTRGGWRCKQVL